jgi:TetR/AcrR family transcriptional regulator, fatty acid biosynthesis regulator
MVLRASPDKKEEKERVRQGLLRAALQLSAAHGFASLGLREVAREGGIAPTSFYRHFADMEELGTALISELAAPVLRGMVERASAAPREGVAPALVDAAFAALVSDAELMRFAIAERTGAYPSLRASLRDQQAALARMLQATCSAPPWAAEAAASVLLDVCGKALDVPPERRDALREPAIAAIQRLMAADAARAP